MKHFKKIAVCLAGGLAFSASLRADDIALNDNPYAPVVERNIFGLNPPVAVDSNPAPVEPPVKITPNGIMSIFGQVQVLFKAATAPGKEDSYILSEGQAQDDIEVTKIDEKAGVVTFNNHGIVQVLPLTAAASSGAPANSSAPARMPNGRNPMSLGGNMGRNGFNNAFGGRTVNGGGNNSGVNNPGVNNAPNLQSNPTPNNINNAASQIPAGMTPDVQTVAIEVNRELTKQQVIDGDLPPLPVTDLTPPDATGTGGAPLVAPSTDAPPQ